MALDKNVVVKKMKERGFVVRSYMGSSGIHFVSEQMYDATYTERFPLRRQIPVINIIVNLEKDEFHCIYQLEKSLTQLKTPACGSILNDEHFDRIVCKFEGESKWMSCLTD